MIQVLTAFYFYWWNLPVILSQLKDTLDAQSLNLPQNKAMTCGYAEYSFLNHQMFMVKKHKPFQKLDSLKAKENCKQFSDLKKLTICKGITLFWHADHNLTCWEEVDSMWGNNTFYASLIIIWLWWWWHRSACFLT